MLFIFFMGLLLLVSIGGISRPDVQTSFHGVLTVCCLLSGLDQATNIHIAILCIFLLAGSSIFLWHILKRQWIIRSLARLFISLFLVILSVFLIMNVLPPSIFRLEYSIVFSIILIGFLNSTLAESIGGQGAGVCNALNAITLLVGLYGQIYAFITILIMYGLFLLITSIMIKKQKAVQT